MRYIFEESTLVQEKFLLDDYNLQLDAFEDLLSAKKWEFLPEIYQAEQQKIVGDGVIIAGELYSPLKMLHLAANPINTTYLLMDHPERAMHLMLLHEKAQLDLVEQMCTCSVKSMMAMDNLDTVFHPPAYIEQYSASFY